jgi:hypothetical protein
MAVMATMRKLFAMWNELALLVFEEARHRTQ